jgi:hypothetical protein
MTDHTSGCLLCGAELVYSTSAVAVTCAICSRDDRSTGKCRNDHFVCDHCHGASALDVIEQCCLASSETDPIALCTGLMRSPTIHMHGPEHHFLVCAVLLTAYDNGHDQSQLKRQHLADAKQRAARVPGGVCGTHGNCGAAVGTGIFWSILTGATPLSTRAWSQANRMTAHSLLRVARHGGPRCCKRDTYLAIQEAMVQTTAMDGTEWAENHPRCEHSARNAQCISKECPYFAADPI